MHGTASSSLPAHPCHLGPQKLQTPQSARVAGCHTERREGWVACHRVRRGRVTAKDPARGEAGTCTEGCAAQAGSERNPGSAPERGFGPEVCATGGASRRRSRKCAQPRGRSGARRRPEVCGLGQRSARLLPACGDVVR